MGPTPDRDIVADDSLSEFQKILLTTDGTVTQLLEIHTRQKIRVQKLSQVIVAGGPQWLEAGPEEPVLSRRILLRGDAKPVLFAHSWLVLSRLPAGLQDSLVNTDTPIGQLWRAARLETCREIVEFRRERDAAVSTLFGADEVLLSRSYRVRSGGLPMGLVTEKFPLSHFTANGGL